MPAIPRILREHFSEFAELLPICRALRGDDDCTEDDLRAWEDRLAAHLDGLLIDPEATAVLLAEAFDGAQAAPVAAATAVGLRLDPATATARAMQFLETCEADDQAAEVITSLREGNADLSACADASGSANERIAGAVFEMLAQRGSLATPPEAFHRLFRSLSPAVRQSAWRVVGDLSLPK